MSTTATIQHHLEGARVAERKARAELDRRQAHVQQLEMQLREAKLMEAASERRREQMRAVMARLRRGETVSGRSNRPIWFSPEGKVLGFVSMDERGALEDLAAQGIVEREHEIRKVPA